MNDEQGFEGVPRPVSDRQLQWVHRNGQKRSRLKPLSAILSQVAQGLPSNDRVATAVYEAVGEVADAEFRALCRFEHWSGGQLTILVTQPDSVYDMRVRWHLPLKLHLEQRVPRCMVRRITFKAGQGGVAF
jgi:hypothetical protein